MEQAFWLDHWQSGHIPFHRSAVNELLVKHYDTWRPQALPIVVPLAGKSVDMTWLAERGHAVIGIEWAEQAVQQYFSELGLSPVVDELGPFTRYQAGNVQLLQGDIFELKSEHLPAQYAVYDRASIVAFNPEQRAQYAQLLAELLPPHTRVLMITIDFDQTQREGPPFAVGPELLDAYFSESFVIEALDKQRIQGKKIECYDLVHLITPKES